mgnify:CR=1 FL=1
MNINTANQTEPQDSHEAAFASQNLPTALTPQLSAMGVEPARVKWQTPKIPSGIVEVDRFFEGGLPQGALCEAGAPIGRGGREVVLRFLAELTTRGISNEIGQKTPGWALWVHGHRDVAVYPPAWQSRGVNLERIRFASTAKPLEDLRPAFMEPFFKMIVIDSPERFSDEDCAFVARMARLHKQSILLLRHFFLSPGRGNVWAKIRFNSSFEFSTKQYHLQVVRGLSPRQTKFSLP